MNGLLVGKRAVVTGGANGIGAAIARHLADAGATEGAVLDLPAALGSTPAPTGWMEQPVDLRDDSSIREAFANVVEKLSGIDVVVAAAGIVPLWPGIDGLDPDEWDEI